MPQQTLSRRLFLVLGLVVTTLAAGAANAAAATESTGRIAWFYKPPGDGTSAARLIEKTQQIILTKGDESFLSQLRGAGYDKPIPQYIDTPYARGPANVLSAGAPCDASYATFRNVVTWFPGDFCRYINQHEGWFLHNGAGKRLYKAESNGGWKYLMNPASAGWRQFTRDRVRQALVGDAEGGPFGYNGIFADDVWVSLHQPKNKMSNSDGSVLEYSNDADWQTAMKGLLAGIRTETHAAGYEMWANLEGSTKGGPYSASVDSYMVENFAASWSGSYASESDTKAVWSLVERDAASGKTVLLVGQGSSSSDTDRGAFAYGAYLMVAGPSILFRYASVNDYKSFWWLPEYDVPLGTPLGSRYLEGDSTWRRDFTGGIALVNLSPSSSRTVQLGGEYLRNGSPVTSVTVGPRRGVLLTRAGEPLPAPPPPAPGAPVPTLPPTVSGAARENSPLTASTGTWEGDPSGFSYQWVRCEQSGGGCLPLEGEVEPALTTTAADLGRRLRVVVTAVNEQGATAADSALTEVVRGSKPRRVRLRAHSRVVTASAFLRRTDPTHVVRTRIRGRILVGAPLRWQVERAADNRRRVVTLLRKKRGAWHVFARVHTTSAGRFQVRREIKTDTRTVRVKAVARYVGFKARSAPVRTRTLG